MESQAEHERQQKDTAKRELESRLEEMSRRKSKFNVSARSIIPVLVGCWVDLKC